MNHRLVQVACERLQYLFSLSEYYVEKETCVFDVGRSFPTLLLDLANYHDDELIQESLHLLNRFYSAEITLFQKAIQTELLVSTESRRVFEEIHLELPALRRLVGVHEAVVTCARPSYWLVCCNILCELAVMTCSGT